MDAAVRELVAEMQSMGMDMTTAEMRQEIWRAFAALVHEHNAQACYSLLDLHSACSEFMRVMS